MNLPKEFSGIIKLSKKGGFVPFPEGKTRDEEVHILPEDTGLAWSGDTVRVTVTGGTSELGKPLAKVAEIIARGREYFVGTLVEENGEITFLPDNERLPRFNVTAGAGVTLKPEYKALVHFLKWESREVAPEGEVEKLLGPVGEHETEIQSIIAGHAIVADFPPAVEKDAEKIKANFAADLAEEVKKRRDFRTTLTFTIDPHDAKDFDDALSFKDLGGDKYEVGVHIADVSHYVKEGSALEEEARKRATSIYLVDRTIPMLPEVLSNDVCSLVPHQDRLTFGAVFTLNKEGKILDEWFGRTVIHSAHRFTYEGAQESLDGKSDIYAAELKILNTIAYALRKEKLAAGAIVFEDSEIKFELDATGKPIRVIQKVRTDSHFMIEDFMLLANRRVAEFASKYNNHAANSFVYRTHDWPSMEKLNRLAAFLKPLGYNLPLHKEKLSPHDLNELLKAAASKDEGHIINRAAVRAMAKATYSGDNIGHWGLAFDHYTHFTSPIRRWPDVLVHRLLAIFLNKGKPSNQLLESIKEDMVHSSAKEVEAADAERESIRYKQVEYMSAHLGEVYDGIISGAADFGIFVEELTTKAEGLVPVREIGDDFYEYDEATISLVGRRTKRRFRLGDKIKIRIKAADPARRRLDLELVK